MLIPIRTENRLTRRPIINYLIVGINIGLFFAGYHTDSPRIQPFLLDPLAPQLEQFFTSMFLHYGLLHLFGNMLFLWVFGNAVNDRFGHVGYLAFYLAGGVLSGVGYVLLSGEAPVLGASGAISAVTGCYLVLFPRVRVTVLLVLIFIMPLEISSLYFLGFQFLFNLWASLTHPGGSVAYVAHSTGYVFGILLAMGLLALRLLPRDVYDLLSLWKAYRRRSQYRSMVSQGYDPFNHGRPGTGKWVPTREVESEPRGDTLSAQSLELRREITRLHSAGDFSGAAQGYLQLIALAGDTVLPRQQQLDVANQLMGEQRYSQAADAYERILVHYPTYEHIADIRLMLGIIYGRYLGQVEKAANCLRLAIDGLHDSRKIEMARAELEHLTGQ